MANKTYWIVKDRKTGVYYSMHGTRPEFVPATCLMSERRARDVFGFVTGPERAGEGYDGTEDPELLEVQPTYEII